MEAPVAEALVAAWERGRGRGPVERSLVLHAMAAPNADRDALADQPLGERNRALLRLRRQWFGDTLAACIDCPQCDERLEFALSVSSLLAQPAPAAPTIDVGGVRFRLPTARDLARIADEPDSATAACRLLGTIVASVPAPDRGTLALLADRVANALDEADPCIDVSLAVDCPACAHRWSVSLDVASYLWDEVDVRAQRLLDEVHVIARAYGWSEAEILALGDARRSAYLERVLG
jgi:hypothetical protein